jgi:hypothetical protein
VSIEVAIHDLLADSAAVAAYVGDRVQPLTVAGDDDLPYITYGVTKEQTDAAIDGNLSDFMTATIEVGIYADTYSECAALSDVIRGEFDQYGETYAGVEFAPLWIDEERDIELIPPSGDEQARTFTRTQVWKTLFRLTA